MTLSLLGHAACSRAIVLGAVWLIATFSPSFDTSMRLSDVATHLHGFVRWDGIFDLSIAQHGYRYEQEYAFGPLYPYMIRHLAPLRTFFF